MFAKQFFQRAIQTIRRRIAKYIASRSPSATEQTLTQRNIYILPSRLGFSYILLLVLLFILGTNYQNNLIVFICYFLISVFITVMLLSFQNLLSLTFIAKGQYFSEAKRSFTIPLAIQSTRAKYGLELAFKNQRCITVEHVDERTQCQLPLIVDKRGVYQLPSVTVKSYFPLGLFVTWSPLRFPVTLVVSPKIVEIQQLQFAETTDDSQSASISQSEVLNRGDDFYAFRQYRAGEPLTHVAWKQVAKGQAWQVRQYAEPQAITQQCFDLNAMPAANIESKLGQLSYLAQQAYGNGQEYAIVLDQETIGLNSGKEHYQQVITAISQFGHNKAVYSLEGMPYDD